MDIFTRLKSIFNAKANALLDEIENPEEALEFSLKEMREQIKKIKKSLLEVTTIKKKLESELEDINGKIKLADEQAELSISLGREDLAKAALEKKQDLIEQKNKITLDIQQIQEKLRLIRQNKEQLETSVKQLEIKKEELIAMNRAADAQITVKEIITGISTDMTEINERITRAENKIREKNAKVAAMNELIEIENLDGLDKLDNLEEELNKVQRDEKIKQELENLKLRLKKGDVE
ncbi:phage shock protein [Caloranaerobacter sp. TR13]|uniref:PspA/IM30 family protein n=1 Tax=Caloranaerobacter sp. TR13 TaxID=1302151 RepID=UPI0006D3CF23|nr:PspA/IM30 family protein [Caloranaerobacter sp. TR13]KPU27296.1 phage shock protein [Caloranaerobacter sp. TR13]